MILRASDRTGRERERERESYQDSSSRAASSVWLYWLGGQEEGAHSAHRYDNLSLSEITPETELPARPLQVRSS